MERYRTPDANIACAQGDDCKTDDSEHPKTQQRGGQDRPDMRSEIGSPMLISAVHKAMFAKGMEAIIRKKQEERSKKIHLHTSFWPGGALRLRRCAGSVAR